MSVSLIKNGGSEEPSKYLEKKIPKEQHKKTESVVSKQLMQPRAPLADVSSKLNQMVPLTFSQLLHNQKTYLVAQEALIHLCIKQFSFCPHAFGHISNQFQATCNIFNRLNAAIAHFNVLDHSCNELVQSVFTFARSLFPATDGLFKMLAIKQLPTDMLPPATCKTKDAMLTYISNLQVELANEQSLLSFSLGTFLPSQILSSSSSSLVPSSSSSSSSSSSALQQPVVSPPKVSKTDIGVRRFVQRVIEKQIEILIEYEFLLELFAQRFPLSTKQAEICDLTEEINLKINEVQNVMVSIINKYYPEGEKHALVRELVSLSEVIDRLSSEQAHKLIPQHLQCLERREEITSFLFANDVKRLIFIQKYQKGIMAEQNELHGYLRRGVRPYSPSTAIQGPCLFFRPIVQEAFTAGSVQIVKPTAVRKKVTSPVIQAPKGTYVFLGEEQDAL